jgi:uncharacterized protein involved in exopolysaccharide biosynthesis
MEEKRNFSDYISVLLKWKKFILIMLLFWGIIITAITFLIPEKYQSTATVMVSSNSGGISAQLSGMLSDVTSLLGVGGGNSGSPVDRMLGIFSSRTLKLRLIQKFNLIDYYELNNYKIDKSLKRLDEDFTSELDENGMIRISCINKRPKLAREILNYAIFLADSMNQFIAHEKAKAYRQFVEKRYNKAINDLKKAEEELKEFQKKTGLYVLPDQLTIILQSIAQMESRLYEKEMMLELAKKLNTFSKPQMSMLEEEIKLLKGQLNDMKNGKTDKSITYYPLKNLPEDFQKYSEIFREFELQKKILETLTPIYEQALMDEQKDIPSLVVLDKPFVPELKYSPKKAQIIILFELLIFLVLIFLAFEGEKYLQNPPRNLYEQYRRRFFDFFVKVLRLKF